MLTPIVPNAPADSKVVSVYHRKIVVPITITNNLDSTSVIDFQGVTWAGIRPNVVDAMNGITITPYQALDPTSNPNFGPIFKAKTEDTPANTTLSVIGGGGFGLVVLQPEIITSMFIAFLQSSGTPLEANLILLY